MTDRLPPITAQPLAVRGAFFECPRWHDGRLWVADFWRHQVLALAEDGTTETVVDLPGPPSGLGWLPDGTLLVVSLMENTLLRVQHGQTEPYADLSALSGGQSNDLVVDAAGRAYVSTINFAAWTERPTTNLVMIDRAGLPTVAAAGLSFPNGSVITPDGATLIVAESWAQRLSAFDIGPDGLLTNRRVGAPSGADATWSCAPDGLTLDADGAIWVADAAGNRVLRVREGGTILAEIGAGDLSVVACALGGADGRTLFLCATRDHRLPPATAVETLPARILTVRVAVPHAGRP